MAGPHEPNDMSAAEERTPVAPGGPGEPVDGHELPCTWVSSRGGVEVAVHDFGGPDNPLAPVVLLAHATGFNGAAWAPMASRLRTRFRCLALDFRGHGRTVTPDGASLAWAAMADDVEAVIGSDRLLGSADVVHGVGHSMGGAALVLAAARRGVRFESLWLYEPVIVPPDLLPFMTGQNPMAAAARRRRAVFPSYQAAVENFSAKPPMDELHPEALRAYVAGGFSLGDDGAVHLRCRPDTEAAVFEGAGHSAVWDVLPRVVRPTQVVRGRDAGFGPGSFAGALVEALPRATLAERADLGHFGPLEDPLGMADDVGRWIHGWGTAPASVC
jgi:pimeloyl-ACP methyl ester carboxylesterase